GPDARCAGDWVIAALGVANQRTGGAKSRLVPEDLLEVFHVCVFHRMSDRFNESSSPDSRRSKEEAIHEIARLVLFSGRVPDALSAPWYERLISEERRKGLEPGLEKMFTGTGQCFENLDRVLRLVGVSDFREAQRIAEALAKFGETGDRKV